MFQLLVFPLVYFSQSHLHYFQGSLISHWHPFAKKAERQENRDRPPVGGHSHSMQECLLLQATQNSPAVSDAAQPVILPASPESILTVPDFTAIPQRLSRTDLARAPPVL